MKLSDVFLESVQGVSANKVRTGLTMLGIVIGIASVIAMTAMGQGSTASITESIESAGANLITVSPGYGAGSGFVRGSRGGATTLTVEDVEAIEQLGNILGVAPQLSGNYQVVASSGNTNSQVVSTTEEYATVYNVDIAEGSFLSESEVSAGSKVAVLGAQVATDIFGDTTEGGVDPVGQTVRINSNRFTVVGVAASTGDNSDNQILIPLKTGQRLLAGQSKYVSTVGVAAASAEVMEQVQADITSLLMERHDITNSDDNDFTVTNQSDIAETLSSTSRTLTVLLTAVAGISLVVGGVGIMNMMLTTVNERTREIGLRKAIGAKRNDITMQFLVESVMLTFGSGIIGVILGWVVSWVLTRFFDTATQVTPSSVVLAFGVSVAIGIVFGLYPATRAAAMNPIEALRYE
jgi:putative ABC transport system permease protein